MPFISAPSLRRCLAVFDGQRPVFALSRGQPAFPIILPVAVLPIVKTQIDAGRFALHQLARATAARRVRLPARDLFNVNTPEDLEKARKRNGRKRTQRSVEKRNG